MARILSHSKWLCKYHIVFNAEIYKENNILPIKRIYTEDNKKFI